MPGKAFDQRDGRPDVGLVETTVLFSPFVDQSPPN